VSPGKAVGGGSPPVQAANNVLASTNAIVFCKDFINLT
jgi:hypothetical protein